MSAPRHPDTMPPALLLGVGLLVSFTIFAIAVSRATGLGHETLPAVVAQESRDLRFADRADGGVLVYEGGARAPFEVIEPGSDGFIRGVLRSFARERRANGLDGAQAFRLRRDAEGRTFLEDLATGRQIALDAFGPTNAGAFAKLLPGPGRTT